VYSALTTILGPLHPFTVTTQVLLEDWLGAEMELPGLLALVQNGLAACVFWMALRFHQFFHDAKTKAHLGPPMVLQMTKLTKQLCLHIFGQLALALPTCYPWLHASHCHPQFLLSPEHQMVPEADMVAHASKNLTPNAAFHTFNKAGQLGAGILKQPVPMTAKGQLMCLSYHLQNACNSNCPWPADHWKHTPVEDNLLLAWAKAALTPAA